MTTPTAPARPVHVPTLDLQAPHRIMMVVDDAGAYADDLERTAAESGISPDRARELRNLAAQVRAQGPHREPLPRTYTAAAWCAWWAAEMNRTMGRPGMRFDVEAWSPTAGELAALLEAVGATRVPLAELPVTADDGELYAADPDVAATLRRLVLAGRDERVAEPPRPPAIQHASVEDLAAATDPEGAGQ